MRKLILSSLISALALVGCANKENNCGKSFLVLWPNSSGHYEMQEVALSTLSNPYELSGPAAKVYYENGLTGSGFDGHVAEPRLTSADGVCVPMDTESSAAVTVYAQFEKLFEFEQKLGTADMLSWPRKVGVDVQMLTPEGVGHNNAHYFSEGDSTVVLPYSLGGLPLGLNHGVIAHEHFHGHFQREVMDKMNPVLEGRAPIINPVDFLFYSFGVKPTEQLDNADLRSNRGLNNFVLRAWNEGLADLFGAIYTENPGFFVESLPQLGSARTLTEDLKRMGNESDLRAVALSLQQTPDQLVSYSYAQGALLARLMYRLANSGVESPQAFLKRVLTHLHSVPEGILATYDDKVLSTEDIVPYLLDGFQLNAGSCAALEKTLSKDMMIWRFQSCR
jgi:hypothetical protein